MQFPKATKNILIWQRIHPSIRDTICTIILPNKYKNWKHLKRKLACNNNRSRLSLVCMGVCLFANISFFKKKCLPLNRCVCYLFLVRFSIIYALFKKPSDSDVTLQSESHLMSSRVFECECVGFHLNAAFVSAFRGSTRAKQNSSAREITKVIT